MTGDPYRTLDVSKDASDAEIKRAYRKLARQYHPDRNPGDAAAEERFKSIQSAYDKIGTAEGRREYDEQRRMEEMFQGGRSRSPFGGGVEPNSPVQDSGSIARTGAPENQRRLPREQTSRLVWTSHWNRL